ncbi:MAG: helix-turn-helix transcriptional regulator [Deltaproteobacteria bacterium]|nr:helix-turn-helix transcriptional regulator [Deltaproteobacteria bacterium]MBW2085376.1 helix-turn-helix transcriptional regulator [Deltaproteobacteria bacterium]
MALMDEYLKDKDYHRLYNQERVILKVTEALCKYMKDHNVSRVELARKLGKNKSFVSQVLNGGRNLTLRTLADFLWALNCELRFELAPTATPRKDEETKWEILSGRGTKQKKHSQQVTFYETWASGQEQTYKKVVN